MRTLITHISRLVGIVPEGFLLKAGAEMNVVEFLDDAWLLVDDGRIADFGTSGSLHPLPSSVHTVDARGGMVMPSFCDPHTHLVWAGQRDGEFIDKINGFTYEQIAARGGGILNSADLLHRTSEEELYRQSKERVDEVISLGTGAIEIKSGYGLNLADELKMLRVIRRLRAESPALIRATFLGAHAVPRGCSHGEYVDAVCRQMIPAVADAKMADFIDVFCDEGFFSVSDAERILTAGTGAGLVPKIHANELAVSGGVQVGVRHHALSVDHLERTGDAELEALRGTGTMPTMLPGSSFFLGLPYGQARRFIQAGLPLALASDYNPGSAPSGDMRFVMALACIQMKLTPEQAFNACTLNAAYALGVAGEVGSVTRGKLANLIVTRPGCTLTLLPYLHHTPFIASHFLRGERVG